MACVREVSSAIVCCPIGQLHLSACPAGLHEVRMEVVTVDFMPVEGAQPPVVMETKDVSNEILQDAFVWLQKYFAREKVSKTPPICMSVKGGDESFMVKCWKTLEEYAPFGQTVTYGLLAGKANRPKAARAIGQAMRRNKWILFVPCHRVLRSDGSVGKQYGGGGISVKKWLIDFEKSRQPSNSF